MRHALADPESHRNTAFDAYVSKLVNFKPTHIGLNPYVHNLTGVLCPRSAFIEVVVACEQIAYWAHAIMQLIAKLRKVRGKLIPKFVRLTIPYLTSDKKWTAYALLMFLVALMLADTTIGVYLIWQTGEFTTALAERDADRFWKSTYLTIFLIAIGFPTFGLYYYVRARLALHWRSWMTSSFMSKYFGQRNYYRISNSPSIDNPDQRIAEDINSFTSKSICPSGAAAPWPFRGLKKYP